jgi:hypothetical protein
LILLIDEAQALSDGELEEVRLLSNMEAPEEKLVDIILAGQPALAERLAGADYALIRQRIEVGTQIAPLAPAEVRRYVEHRLQVAGQARTRILSRAALAALAEVSAGVPRKINTVCFEALSQAFAEGRKKISEAALRRATGVLLPVPGAVASPVVLRRPKLGWVAAAVCSGIVVGALAANLYSPRRPLEWRLPAWFFGAVTPVQAAPPPILSPAPGPALADSSLAQPPSSGQVRVSPAQEIPGP